MERPQFGRLTVRRGGWHREPLGRVGKIERLFEVELRAVAQAGGFKGNGIAIAEDGELTAMQGRGALAGAVGHPHRELRSVIVEVSRRAPVAVWDEA